MTEGRFPRATQNSIPEAGKAPGIEYVDLNRMGIGARSSGVPKEVSTGPRPIEHVGGSTGNGR